MSQLTDMKHTLRIKSRTAVWISGILSYRPKSEDEALLLNL